jgi:methylglutaconyl-CoA hydratase
MWKRFLSSSSSTQECFIERLTGSDTGISVLRLNRPQAKNALGITFMSQFKSALDTLKYDPSTRVLILSSTVPKVFCAGADLKERREMSPVQVSAFVNDLRSSFNQLQHLPMPTISVLDGAALGGGLELALATDVRVAGSDARLGILHSSILILSRTA